MTTTSSSYGLPLGWRITLLVGGGYFSVRFPSLLDWNKVLVLLPFICMVFNKISKY